MMTEQFKILLFNYLLPIYKLKFKKESLKTLLNITLDWKFNINSMYCLLSAKLPGDVRVPQEGEAGGRQPAAFGQRAGLRGRF